jgi:hypothetical protein
MKKITLQELKDLYWDFRKILIIESVTFSSYGGGGSGGGYDKLVYKDTIQDFLLWLETKMK